MTDTKAGNPRSPEPVPLENPDKHRILQFIDRDGKPTEQFEDSGLDRDTIRDLYKVMVLLRAIDERGWKLQRSGRIAFWIPMRGQEAVQVAATHAMNPSDWIFRDHRTMAPWLMRGGSLTTLFAQLFGAASEPQKGRRLPCLVGNRAVNMVQGPTQVGSFITHACGVAWAAKLKGSDVRVLGMFGDGATSRGEFHSAMNFAGIHRPPAVFLCINNSWAVSTPLDCQTASPEFAAKGDAYEVPNLRVDGNDLFAVYAAVRRARETGLSEGPTLIEAITWRQGFHTSSDNPDLYRREQENKLWLPWDPISRTRDFMTDRGWWSDEDEVNFQQRCTDDIQNAVEEAETMPIPGPDSQFEDVFAQSHWMLDEQRERLLSDVGFAEVTG